MPIILEGMPVADHLPNGVDMWGITVCFALHAWWYHEHACHWMIDSCLVFDSRCTSLVQNVYVL